jgi:hypothetical protein
VSAGQKSGFFHVLDAKTGAEVADPIQLAPPGTVGGLFADSAYVNGVVYANGVDWPTVLSGGPPNRGILSAVKADGSKELWHFDTPFSPNASGVAVANGVVYFQSMLDGTFYALNAKTGAPLAQVVTGGQSSGPAISRGQIYIGTGDSAFPFLDPTLPIGPGSITALGIDDPARSRPFLAAGAGNLTSADNDFTARGIATHMVLFTHTGGVILTPTDDPAVFRMSGRTEYVAANGDKLFAILDGTLNVETGVASGTDTWDGGTGRFADARGVVDLSGQIDPDGSFTFTLKGRISF